MELNVVDVLKSVDFRDKNWIVICPSILMVIDFLTGLIDACLRGHLKSFKMRDGLNHKAGELSILLVGEMITYGMNLPLIYMKGISLYIMLMEIVSICENLDRMGIWIPKWVKKFFRNAKETIDNANIFSGKEDDKDDNERDSDGTGTS